MLVAASNEPCQPMRTTVSSPTSVVRTQDCQTPLGLGMQFRARRKTSMKTKKHEHAHI